MTSTETQQFLNIDISNKRQEINNLINRINDIRKSISKKRMQIKELERKKRGEEE